MKLTIIPILPALSLAFAACSSMAQETAIVPEATQAVVDRLIEQGLGDDTGLQFVEDLTTEVGPRLAGSEAEAG